MILLFSVDFSVWKRFQTSINIGSENVNKNLINFIPKIKRNYDDFLNANPNAVNA